jgi:hypothetical protein
MKLDKKRMKRSTNQEGRSKRKRKLPLFADNMHKILKDQPKSSGIHKQLK